MYAHIYLTIKTSRSVFVYIPWNHTCVLMYPLSILQDIMKLRHAERESQSFLPVDVVSLFQPLFLAAPPAPWARCESPAEMLVEAAAMYDQRNPPFRVGESSAEDVGSLRQPLTGAELRKRQAHEADDSMIVGSSQD